MSHEPPTCHPSAYSRASSIGRRLLVTAIMSGLTACQSPPAQTVEGEVRQNRSDAELRTMLQNDKWCTTFTEGNRSHSQSATFMADGKLSRISGFSSPGTSGNTVAIAEQWDLANGVLKLSTDGKQWTDHPLVTTAQTISFEGRTWGRCN